MAARTRPQTYQIFALPCTRPLLGRVARSLGDSRYVVATAAIQAFAALPVVEQARHLARVREQVAAAGGEGSPA